jgi:hypothetical protein
MTNDDLTQPLNTMVLLNALPCMSYITLPPQTPGPTLLEKQHTSISFFLSFFLYLFSYSQFCDVAKSGDHLQEDFSFTKVVIIHNKKI